MVGRFVQQQQIGRHEQHARQGDAHPPATGELLRRPSLSGRVEAEASEDRGRSGRGAIGLDGAKPVVDFRCPVRCRLASRLGQQCRALGIRGQHAFQQACLARRRFLCDMAKPGAGGEPDLAAIGLDFAEDRPQQS